MLLEDLTWLEAEAVLNEHTIVLLPLGAAAKEHGPHLKLNNDLVLANYFRDRLLETHELVAAPTLNYHHYPAFVEYPGSTSLRSKVAFNLTLDICRNMTRFGPKRFYCLNTGVSTLEILANLQKTLAQEQVLFHYANFHSFTRNLVNEICTQVGGGHADEIETSIMLYIAPERVDMNKAVDDYHPGNGLSRTRKPGVAYSKSGVYGNATLASADKGKQLVTAIVAGMHQELKLLKDSDLPIE